MIHICPEEATWLAAVLHELRLYWVVVRLQLAFFIGIFRPQHRDKEHL